MTPNKGSVTLDRLRGKCIVLWLDDYLQYKPTDFSEEDIFVCEYKYLGRRLHFKRFTTWPYPDEINTLAKEARPEDFNPQKTMTSEFVSREVNPTFIKRHNHLLFRTHWHRFKKPKQLKTTGMLMKECVICLPFLMCTGKKVIN